MLLNKTQDHCKGQAKPFLRPHLNCHGDALTLKVISRDTALRFQLKFKI